MAEDFSFSTSSTLSYVSMTDDTISMDDSDASSLIIYPINIDTTSSDSNIECVTQIISDELEKTKTCLYEISVEIKMELPKDENFNKADILRATIYTICGDIIFKHEKCKSFGSLIAYQIGKKLNPTLSTWLPIKGKKLFYHGQFKVNGHCIDIDDILISKIIIDKIKFNDFICATNIKLNYTADVFLTPAIAGAERIYSLHGFDVPSPNFYYKEKHMDDIIVGHKNEKLKNYNQHLAWSIVYNVLEEYRQNVIKQNLFMDHYGFCF